MNNSTDSVNNKTTFGREGKLIRSSPKMMMRGEWKIVWEMEASEREIYDALSLKLFANFFFLVNGSSERDQLVGGMRKSLIRFSGLLRVPERNCFCVEGKQGNESEDDGEPTCVVSIIP